ncbi:MAG: beta-lactamase family protein [Myxococcota bacterium]|nr:beta-lactamase family protein [Myxococcota bacterium]MDW8363668.1 serine hydrolase domain-containing protein [Myxococcales bacterium]
MGGDRQFRLEREAARLLAAGVAGGVFPGASAAVAWWEDGSSRLAVASAGRIAVDGLPVGACTLFDLASLTKPIVATTALRLVAAGRVALDMRVETWIPDVRGTTGGVATLESLLAHRSGLAAWGGLYLDVPHEIGTTAARRWLVAEAARRADDGPAGRCVYSDLGYILAGELLARATDTSLERLVEAEVTGPLGVSDELGYLAARPVAERSAMLGRIAATERCDWRGRLVHAEVHDENCAAMGGIAGHAGIFGTARAVATFGRAWLDVLAGRSSFLPIELARAALPPPAADRFGLGWDGKRMQQSAAGDRIASSAFGHLGFTGTSIWCDPERDVVIVLLTNRIHPSRANEKIRGFRPVFHDRLVAAFEERAAIRSTAPQNAGGSRARSRPVRVPVTLGGLRPSTLPLRPGSSRPASVPSAAPTSGARPVASAKRTRSSPDKDERDGASRRARRSSEGSRRRRDTARRAERARGEMALAARDKGRGRRSRRADGKSARAAATRAAMASKRRGATRTHVRRRTQRRSARKRSQRRS